MQCPHCTSMVFRPTSDGQKLKARTRVLVLHKSGAAEINCEACGRGVLLPLTLSPGDMALTKAAPPKFVARRS